MSIGSTPLSVVPISSLETAASGVYTLTCDSAALTLTAQAATLTVTRILVADSAALTLTAQDASLVRGYTLVGDSAALSLTPQDATLLYNRVLTADSAAMTLTPQDAALLRAYTLTADSAALALTPQDATLTYSPALAAYTLTCDAGVLTLTAQDAALIYTPVSVGVGGGAYKRPTREEIDHLKRLLGYSKKQVQALIKRKPGVVEAALQAFRYSGDAEQLLAAIHAQDEYKRSQARLKQAADREALLALQARFEDDAITLLLILAAMEW
jgi:hypothetical protein